MYTVTANTKWCDGPPRAWSTITLDWHGANIKTEFAAVPYLVPKLTCQIFCHLKCKDLGRAWHLFFFCFCMWSCVDGLLVQQSRL